MVILGLNGAGKTTLLRLLGGVEDPDTGEVVPGHGLRLGYYAQEHDTLDTTRTVLENMASASPDFPEVAPVPSLHRVRFGDVLGSGRPQLIAAPLQGRGVKEPDWGAGPMRAQGCLALRRAESRRPRRAPARRGPRLRCGTVLPADLSRLSRPIWRGTSRSLKFSNFWDRAAWGRCTRRASGSSTAW